MSLRSAENGEDVFLAEDDVLPVVDLHLGTGILPEEDAVADLHIEADTLALVRHFAGADGDDLSLLRLLFGGVGDDDAAPLHFLLLEAFHQYAVVQWTNLHARCPSRGLCMGAPYRRPRMLLALLIDEC